MVPVCPFIWAFLYTIFRQALSGAGCNILFMVSFLVKICYLDLWRFALCCCHIYLSALRSHFVVLVFFLRFSSMRSAFFPTEILEPLCLVTWPAATTTETTKTTAALTTNSKCDKCQSIIIVEHHSRQLRACTTYAVCVCQCVGGRCSCVRVCVQGVWLSLLCVCVCAGSCLLI